MKPKPYPSMAPTGITGVNHLQTYLERFLHQLSSVGVLWLKKSSQNFSNYPCLSWLFVSSHFNRISKFLFTLEILDCVQLDLLWQGNCGWSAHWCDAGEGNLNKLEVMEWQRADKSGFWWGTYALCRVNEHFYQDLPVSAVALFLGESLFSFAGLVSQIYTIPLILKNILG